MRHFYPFDYSIPATEVAEITGWGLQGSAITKSGRTAELTMSQDEGDFGLVHGIEWEGDLPSEFERLPFVDRCVSPEEVSQPS